MKTHFILTGSRLNLRISRRDYPQFETIQSISLHRDKLVRNSLIRFSASIAFIGLLLTGRIVLADPIGDLLAETPSSASAQISRAKKLIADNPADERLIELTLYLTTELLLTSNDKDYRRSMIPQFESIANLADKAGNRVVSYKSTFWIGNIYKDSLKDYERAFNVFKGLEQHPIWANNGVEYDYLHCNLYTSIAEAAELTANRSLVNEADSYSRLVMEYPYLKLPFGSDIFSRFSLLYQRAGLIQIHLHSNSADYLNSLDIPPSQLELSRLRDDAIGRKARNELLTAREMPLHRIEASISFESACRCGFKLTIFFNWRLSFSEWRWQTGQDVSKDESGIRIRP